MPLIVAGKKIDEFRLKSRGAWLFAWITSAATITGIGSFFFLFGHPALPYVGWLSSVVAFVAMVASAWHWWLSFRIEFYWQDDPSEESVHLEYLEPNLLQKEVSKIIRPLQHITFQDDIDEPKEANNARRLFSAKLGRRSALFFYMPLMQAVNVVLLIQLIALVAHPR